MDELNAMLSQIMSDPEAMKQIQSVAASLGLGGNAAPQAASPPPAQSAPDLSALASLLGGQQSSQPAQSAPDLSALASLLGGQQSSQPAQNMPDLSALASLLGGQQSSQPAQNMPDLSALASLLGGQQSPSPSQGMPDLSSLSGLLGNLTGGNRQETPAASGIPALTALLNAGNAQRQPAQAGILPNIDLSSIAKLSQAFAGIQSNRANVDLLLALKPRLKDERAKKVDDAIRVMQLIQFLPLIKESGIFGEMDKIIGGSGAGGLGGLLGNVGNGIGGLLGGLGRR